MRRILHWLRCASILSQHPANLFTAHLTSEVLHENPHQGTYCVQSLFSHKLAALYNQLLYQLFDTISLGIARLERSLEGLLALSTPPLH